MTRREAATWFTARTNGAPSKLRDRAASYFAAAAGGSDLVRQLSTAGTDALRAATSGGADRAAALDLLAADALITLALLAAAEASPATLGATAAALRQASIAA
ncbi:MAG TPA: hypothetical protein VGM20_05130 [Gemmatimonadales bacterium]